MQEKGRIFLHLHPLMAVVLPIMSADAKDAPLGHAFAGKPFIIENYYVFRGRFAAVSEQISLRERPYYTTPAAPKSSGQPSETFPILQKPPNHWRDRAAWAVRDSARLNFWLFMRRAALKLLARRHARLRGGARPMRRSALELLAQKFCGTPPTGLIAVNWARVFC